MHTAEPLVPGPGSFEIEVAIEKLKRYKSSDFDQILAELILEGSNILRSEITNLLIAFGIRRSCHSSEHSLLLHLFIKKRW
jgi:hypothetical protein